MTDDLIRMAREAGLTQWHADSRQWSVPNGLDLFAALVRADEREKCARLCDAKYVARDADGFVSEAGMARTLADAIRERIGQPEQPNG